MDGQASVSMGCETIHQLMICAQEVTGSQEYYKAEFLYLVLEWL